MEVTGAAHVMSGSREQHERIAFFSVVSTSSTGALLARVGRRLHRKTTEDSQTIHGSVMGEYTIEARVLLT